MPKDVSDLLCLGRVWMQQRECECSSGRVFGSISFLLPCAAVAESVDMPLVQCSHVVLGDRLPCRKYLQTASTVPSLSRFVCDTRHHAGCHLIMLLCCCVAALCSPACLFAWLCHCRSRSAWTLAGRAITGTDTAHSRSYSSSS
jgi:hypothetical protein